MLHNVNPTETTAWKKLTAHFSEIKNSKMIDLFASDPERFNKFNLKFEDILLDYSKNRINSETVNLLIELAKETRLTDAIDAMFAGKKINRTEKRAVLHTALRNRSERPVFVDEEDVMPEVNAVLEQMKAFCNKIAFKEWKGFSGKDITDIVNIGIGGSDLGPVMVTEALKPYAIEGLNIHFVSNVDGTHISEVLKRFSLKPHYL